MSALHIIGVLILIGINAYFSAVEFSLVAVRQSRIRQLAREGNARARVVELLLADMGRVVSGVQVGITLTSLSLGYLGEIALSRLLDPLVQMIPRPWAALTAHGVALVLAFGLLTVLQVTFGELVPKGLSLARAERVALLVARPFYWFLHTFRWAIDLLDGFAEKVLRPLGVTGAQSHTAVRSTEELQAILQQAREGGLLPATEVQFIQNSMELSGIQVREIMVPRPDMHVLPIDASLDDVMRMFATTQRSRLPVYEGTIDHIAGFVHVKDAMWVLVDRSRRAEENQPPLEFHLKSLLRDVLIVPETKPASELLLEFRSRRAGLAMVVDEFGSILGLVTLEDILEQMVGEIHDEFDVEERPLMLPDGGLIFDAAINVRDLEAQYNIALPEDPAYETVGGYVLSRLGVIPRGGESFEGAGYRFTVMEMDRRRISRVKIQRLQHVLPHPGTPHADAGSHAPDAKTGAEHHQMASHHAAKEQRAK
ncbi:MAG TPA: hemolysin family protein [Candidatus Acidoferrales bacterium]|nr:hemolysin family protein [Candidatus Acidoferrales bacterium]